MDLREWKWVLVGSGGSVQLSWAVHSMDVEDTHGDCSCTLSPRSLAGQPLSSD